MSLQRENMSTVDTAWLHMERPTNLMMITGIMTFDAPLDLQRLKALFEQRLLRFDRFRQRVVDPQRPLRGPRWELDPYFDLNAHVRRIALPAPGDKAALENLVSDLMSTTLDFSKPLWQFHLVENLGAGCALVGRLHHSIADGIALVRVLLSLTDETADAVWINDTAAHPARSTPGLLRTLLGPARAAAQTTRKLTGTVLHESLATLQNPGRVVDLAKVAADGAATLGKMALRWPDPPTIFKGNLGVMKRATWSNKISLADVKAVGKVTGGTVNDLLLTAVTGALRRYMQERGVDTTGLNFRAMVPVNLRPLDEPIQLGNRFGLVFLALPIGIIDHLERLTELKRRMDNLKDSPEAVMAITVLSTMGMLPTDFEDLFISFFGSKATAVMTNVPGPRDPIYLAGEQIQSLMAWVPQSGRLGLGVSIISYAGSVLVGVSTDAGLVPDPERVLDHLEIEFAEMLELARVAAETADS